MTTPSICITATFTVEPIKDALNYWMQELKFPFQIHFAPYNQVFQQLLDPASLLCQNQKGVNIVLLRLEDWQRFEKADANSHEKIMQNVSELIQALQSAETRSSSPFLVCVCPASPALLADAKTTAFFQEMELHLKTELEPLAGIHWISPADLATYYPVKEYYDAFLDKSGHIPYTDSFFTALATMLARKIYALQTPARKVIVLDCDNTLWKGVCGESGPFGIMLDAPYLALQQFMLAQHAAGRLLCLCSKNSEMDVVNVFEQRSDMPLKLEYIIAWRINWQAKSENLISLANELQLGLDSFIFVDDNPLECAEVQSSCPDVLTLQLPEKTERITRFIQQAWPFDYLKITATDQKRTALYRENRQREQARQQASTFEDFLATLELEIQIAEMTPNQLERVAELTQRTNQFNVTTIRRSEHEIQQLQQAKKLDVFTVHVRDRFGDYGLVGVFAFETQSDTLHVDTFLLSCRALGRGVEYQMLQMLINIANEKQLQTVSIPFVTTPKNQPALDFLNKVGADYRQADHQNGWRFIFPTQITVHL
jgi:FkbH-like protein